MSGKSPAEEESLRADWKQFLHGYSNNEHWWKL